VNKEQKKYLKEKLANIVRANVAAHHNTKPVSPDKAVKIQQVLEKAGFVAASNIWGNNSWNSIASHVRSKEEVAFQAKHDAYARAQYDILITATDAIELGDSEDALAVLQKFTDMLNS